MVAGLQNHLHQWLLDQKPMQNHLYQWRMLTLRAPGGADKTLEFGAYWKLSSVAKTSFNNQPILYIHILNIQLSILNGRVSSDRNWSHADELEFPAESNVYPTTTGLQPLLLLPDLHKYRIWVASLAGASFLFNPALSTWDYSCNYHSIDTFCIVAPMMLVLLWNYRI